MTSTRMSPVSLSVRARVALVVAEDTAALGEPTTRDRDALVRIDRATGLDRLLDDHTVLVLAVHLDELLVDVANAGLAQCVHGIVRALTDDVGHRDLVAARDLQ